MFLFLPQKGERDWKLQGGRGEIRMTTAGKWERYGKVGGRTHF